MEHSTLDRATLTPAQHQIRWNVRNFLLTATIAELVREKELSLERGDPFRAECIQELIDES
jgi:hypothetical protein